MKGINFKKNKKLIIISIIAIAVIYLLFRPAEGFVTVDPLNYPGGTIVAFRVINSLAEISANLTDYLRRNSGAQGDITVFDCSYNQLWKVGDPISTDTVSALYTLSITGGALPPCNLVQLYNRFVSQIADRSVSIGLNMVSLVLSNIEYPSKKCLETGGARGAGGSGGSGLTQAESVMEMTRQFFAMGISLQ